MAATNRSIDYNALLTMTADNYYKSGVIHDGVFKSNPTFAKLNKKGLKMVETGGGKIQVNLMYGKNSTVDSYSRYGLLDTAPQDGFTPAFYDWAQYAGTVSIDGLSEFQNSGAPQIQKLLREKIKQLTMSFAERMNEDLWDVETITTAPGNGGKNIIPIPHFIQGADAGSDWGAGIDPGGINQSAETWWKNQSLDSGSTTFAGTIKEMRNMYNDCGKGSGGTPDIMIANQDVFELYETIMDERVRYRSSDTATVGFESIKFKSADLFWDEHIPDPIGDGTSTGYNWDHASYAPTTQGAIYYINSKNLDLVCGKGKDFAPLGFDSPTNQDARVGKWVFYGQLVCNNRRKLGMIEDLISTQVS